MDKSENIIFSDVIEKISGVDVTCTASNITTPALPSKLHLIYAYEDKPQRKEFYLSGNARDIKQKAAAFNKYWLSRSVEIKDIGNLYATLTKYQNIKSAEYYAVIRGQYIDLGLLELCEEKRKLDIAKMGKEGREVSSSLMDPLFIQREGDKHPRYLRRKNIIEDTPLSWVCIDFDGLEVDGGFDLSNPGVAIDKAIASELGSDFVNASYVLQLSSSAGIKNGISAHVWFWLENPMDGSDWQAWLDARTVELGRRPNIDPSMFQAERIHYIANPKFKGQAVDPVLDAGQGRWALVRKGEEYVDISHFENLKEVSEVKRQKVKAKVGIINSSDDESEKAQEAYSRPGVVGAFNRAFSMSETINRFLSDHYRIDTEEGRVTWLGGSGAQGGCKIVCGNTRMFSTHQSDPLEGYVGHAFDHIQFILFDGDYRTAAGWAGGIEEVKEELEKAEMSALGNIEIGEDCVAEKGIIWRHDKTKDAEAILDALANSDLVFSQGQKLVEPWGASVVRIATPERIQIIAHKAGMTIRAEPTKNNPSGMVSDKAILVTCRAALSYADAPALRRLERVSDRPLFDASTGALTAAGYHADSYTLVQPVAPWDGLAAALPDRPTRADLDAALAYLADEALRGFEFECENDKAAALALLVTAACRHALKIAPAFAVLASQPSSGKTSLCHIAQTIAGDTPTQGGLPSKEDEVAKYILAKLGDGCGTILFDNVGSGWSINSASLNRLITSEIYEDRLLGRSETLRFVNNRMVILNGNGLKILGDMATRAVVVNLTSADLSPENRSFARDPAGWAKANQSRLVGAALTVARYGAQNALAVPACRFPAWAKLVAAPIAVAGYGDALAGQAEAKAASDAADRLPMGNVVRALKGVFEDKPFRVSDVLKNCDGKEFCPLYEALANLGGGDLPRSLAHLGRLLTQITKLGDFPSTEKDRGLRLVPATIGKNDGYCVIDSIQPAAGVARG